MWCLANNGRTGIPFPVRYAENIQTMTVSGRPGAAGRPAAARPAELPGGGDGVLDMPAVRRTVTPGDGAANQVMTPAQGTGPAQSLRACAA